MTTRNFAVLVVDDDDADVYMTSLALSKIHGCGTVHSVCDGMKALQFLRKEFSYASAPTPDLVLLDLNMPRMSGWDVLREIKKDPKLHDVSVVIFSSSANPADTLQALENGADLFVSKPIDMTKLTPEIERIVRTVLPQGG